MNVSQLVKRRERLITSLNAVNTELGEALGLIVVNHTTAPRRAKRRMSAAHRSAIIAGLKRRKREVKH